MNKIPSGRYTVIGTIVFSTIACLFFYVAKTEVSKCIAFYGGWDCGMVANSARWVFEGKGIGYDDYYYVYINNVPITWILHILYRFSNSLAGYAYNPEFIWIQFQCLMFALAVFLVAMTVLLVSRRAAVSLLSLLMGLAVLGLCPWQIIPYTDATTIAGGVLVIFLYALFRRVRWKWKYAIWFGVSFAGAWWGIMKATSYVAVIAVTLTESVWLLLGKGQVSVKIRGLALQAVLLVCGFVLAAQCRSGMYETLHYVPDHDLQATWSNAMYVGLNETETGACSGDGLELAKAYAGYPASVRRKVELQLIKGRMQEKGFRGLLDFWLRKQVMNFNDGTFSWFQEGWFNAWEYENLTDSRLKEPLRSFYWKEEPEYLKFTTWSQGIWLFVLLGLILEAVVCCLGYYPWGEDEEMLCLRTVHLIFFLGVFGFVMLFEGRARYLLNNVPVLIAMSALGYGDLFGIILQRKT